MQGASKTFVAVVVSVTFVSACGGGKYGGAPSSANYDLQTGIANMVATGLSANVALSGTTIVNGVSQASTGTGEPLPGRLGSVPLSTPPSPRHK